jgi:voltage-gated potassium channel
MRDWLKRAIEKPDDPAGRTFSLVVTILIFLSVISFSIDTLSSISPELRKIIDTTEIIITVAFTAEYIARIITADSKLSYIFSFMGIVDAASILPFYFAVNGLRW